MQNLFSEDKVYCYCSYNDNTGIKEVDTLIYSDVNSIIEHVKETLSPIINNGGIVIIFGNVEGADFIASNDGTDAGFLYNNSEFEKYFEDFESIVDDFESEVNDENPIFESDGYLLGESTFIYNPENEYNYDNDEITEDGWDNVADCFIESVEEISEKYPINILSSTKSDFDEIEYQSLNVKFDIEPAVINTRNF